ncbi:MAG: PilZ domain-containing protein [Gammaproteobacteria bacterium]|nr:PilZ domain-containing protein [Gammaproteobacteria bacterium]NIU52062.1 hypothetical protein [Gemmatimonadota bacterium]NIR81944.1 PilZ domain-containing protein [Gammaproteobacteria bacterium]NIU03046.1 PilZ domain-containing protein [Gammaproteobacteria bacterium]NIV50570.1 hypothetical protein [Gammaproteobacteria bacterium]
MERREAQRTPAASKAVVYYAGRRIGLYRVLDVSPGGLRLAPGAIMFYQGTPLEVICPGSGGDESALQRLSGEVVHASPAGIGLAFRGDDAAETRVSSPRAVPLECGEA